MWTVWETPDGPLLTSIMLVVLTVVLEFTVFTVTLMLVWASMGVLPTLLLIKVSPFPFDLVVSSVLICLIPLFGSSRVRNLLSFSRPVIVVVILLWLFASTMACPMSVVRRLWTARLVLVPMALVTMTRLVQMLLMSMRRTALLIL